MLLSIILDTAKFGLRNAMVAVLWNLTNSSESQSAPMLLGRRNKPQFNFKRRPMHDDAGENSPGTTNYSPFLSCMINVHVFELTASHIVNFLIFLGGGTIFIHSCSTLLTSAIYIYFFLKASRKHTLDVTVDLLSFAITRSYG